MSCLHSQNRSFLEYVSLYPTNTAEKQKATENSVQLEATVGSQNIKNIKNTVFIPRTEQKLAEANKPFLRCLRNQVGHSIKPSLNKNHQWTQINVWQIQNGILIKRDTCTGTFYAEEEQNRMTEQIRNHPHNGTHHWEKIREDTLEEVTPTASCLWISEKTK